MSAKLPIDDDKMRSLVLGSISKTTQANQLYDHIYRLAVDRGILPAPQTASVTNNPGIGIVRVHDPNVIGGLPPSNQVQVQDILWDLLIEGILRSGDGGHPNDSFPSVFHLTERGKQAVQNGSPSPYDYREYLDRLKKISAIDPVIIVYVAESLQTFRMGCFLASTVTLGCAAEKAMLLLMDATAKAMTSPQDSADFIKKTEDKFIKTRCQVFTPILDNKIKPLLKASNSDLADRLDVQLQGIFEIIRIQRNAAGHPEGITIVYRDADTNLHIFFTFLHRIYALIDWLTKNKI